LSSDEIREVAASLDNALMHRNVEGVVECFTDDCEISLLNLTLHGEDGVRRWFNWLYSHVAEMKLIPVTVIIDNNVYFEEYEVEARLHNGGEAYSSQAEVLVFRGSRIKSLRMYFDRLDFSASVAKGIISKTIINQLIKRSVEGLQP
jgi:ketosteroid isomerase-like protein